MEYPTQKILELAYAAKRRIGEYRKESRYAYDSDGHESRMFHSNKDLIRWTLLHEQGKLVVDNFEPLVVSDEDRAAVEEAHKHMRRYVFLALGNISQFTKDFYAVYCKETIALNDTGRLAYFPYFVENDRKNLDFNKRLKTEFADSKWLDTVGGIIEILTKRYLSEYNKYSYLAGYNGNLVSFFAGDQFDVNQFYNIRAKVKGRGEERQTKLPVTYLNYVKGV